MEKPKIIEIAFELTSFQLEFLEEYLKNNAIAYSIEPAGRFVSLEDIECL